jgi:hypothetical protein
MPVVITVVCDVCGIIAEIDKETELVEPYIHSILIDGHFDYPPGWKGDEREPDHWGTYCPDHNWTDRRS